MKGISLIGATRRKDTKSSVARRHDEAMDCRRRDFWHPILKVFYYGYEKLPAQPIDAERYKVVRQHVLQSLEEGAAGFAKGVCRLPLAYTSQRQLFDVVMFIAAFDPGFRFTPADPEDSSDPVDSDTLPGESAFQLEVWSALDKYILEGAKLARRVASAKYFAWTKALVMLSDVMNGRYEKCEIEDAVREIMQLIIDAQQQLWADVRVSG